MEPGGKNGTTLIEDSQLGARVHSMTCQCNTRPTVNFPAKEHHRPLSGTELYSLVTGAHLCKRRAQGCYVLVNRRESNTRPLDRGFDVAANSPPAHTAAAEAAIHIPRWLCCVLHRDNLVCNSHPREIHLYLFLD